MLRAHAWKARGYPFICESCRVLVSPTYSPGHRRAAPTLRPICTTSELRNSDEKGKGNVFVGPGPAGRFAAGPAFAGGSWGSFASVKKSPDDSSAVDDSLLPHELEAKRRAAAAFETKTSTKKKPSQPTQSSQSSQRFKKSADATSSVDGGLLPHELEARKRAAAFATKTSTKTPSQPSQSSKPSQPKTRFSNGHESHLNKSKSILANVFKSIATPGPSVAAKSTPTSTQTPPTPSSTSALVPDAAAIAKSSSPSSDEKAHPSHGKESHHEPSKVPPGGAPRQVGWGTFSHRKSQTPIHAHAHNQGNASAAWSEITRSKKTQGDIQNKPRVQATTGQPIAAKSAAASTSEVASATQDFWGELDTRVADLKEGKGKGRQEVLPAADGRARKSSEKVSGDSGDALHSGDTASSHRVSNDGDWQNERRKSRFEMEEEARFNERRSKKSKKSSSGRRMHDDDWDDESTHRWEHKQRRKAEKEAQRQKKLQEEQSAVPIFLPEYISASNLAQALKQKPDQFLADMEEMGFENVTPDTIMTGETAALISMEYGFEPTVDTGSQRDLKPRPVPEDVSSLPSRPPVVTIMGHVDHGKTTLLDWLRKSSVAAQEHGGITQHIGAFVVQMSTAKQITFLDTPGHAAFLSMRQRGAHVTDIVVLVVAADDSVMPQTLEALKHATAAKVPIIVAINKIDKDDARVDQVKADLARHGVEIEDFGGDVQVVCVSGKTGQGMADLEENIITLSEILDVRAEHDGMAEGWILESSVKQNGKAATVLVKRGTLRPGDLIVAGKTWARIRVIRNEAGKDLAEAPPGSPVEIMGWRDLPDAGQQVLQAPDEAKAKTAVEYRVEMAGREESSVQLAEQEQRQREKAAAAAAAAAAAVSDANTMTTADGDQTEQKPAEPGILCQNFTVKADVVGSVEAVCGSVLELGNHEVQPKILRSAAGQISEYDIDHAAASNSIIINFNVPVLPRIKQRAEDAKVKILDHNVIYHVVDDVKAALSALLPMNITTRVSGEADILQVFPINIKKRVSRNIAGCRVRNGVIKKSSLVKVIRKGKVIYEGKIDTLRHVKKDVMEMGKGSECGIGLEGFQEFQVDDQIQTYEEIKEKQTL
ncbi:hypothetical protein E4U43_000460 [Claviceps pusilla]|uniref:Translation initiation factor IF-2, mitochondrial n=1 Tax=Claviceps pusilla TaxID=123648 RepID=A0A9P7SXN2_9HYPO|nr:hypothetical protein E4U43_000460 [Claviceps pusilla]